MLVVCGIFLMVLGISLYATVAGFRMFNQTNARQQLQRDASAVFAWMQRDLESSNLLRCVVEERVSADMQARSRLGLVGLNDWREPISRDALGHPNWDRVIIYSASRDDGTGQVLRQSIVVPSGAVPATIHTVTDLMITGSGAGADLRRLAGGVRSFLIQRSIPHESVTVSMVLEKRTNEVGSGGSRTEVLEVQSAVRPRNTFPNL